MHTKKDDDGPYYRLKIIGHEDRAEKFTEDADISKKKKVTVSVYFLLLILFFCALCVRVCGCARVYVIIL